MTPCSKKHGTKFQQLTYRHGLQQLEILHQIIHTIRLKLGQPIQGQTQVHPPGAKVFLRPNILQLLKFSKVVLLNPQFYER